MNKILSKCPVCNSKKITYRIDGATNQKIYFCEKCNYVNVEKVTKQMMESVTFL